MLIASRSHSFEFLSVLGPDAFLACLNNNVSLIDLKMEEELGADMNEILNVAVTRDNFAPHVREKAARLLDSNRNFQQVSLLERVGCCPTRRTPYILPSFLL